MIGTDDAGDETIRVLYVNDDEGFRELVRTKLGTIAPDFEVTTVGTADSALDRLAASQVDCVVTSYSLPDSSGIELLRTLAEEGHDLSTIIFTGQGDEQVASQATQAGVSDYIPLHADQDNFEVLARRVQTLVEAARKEELAERVSERFERTLERTTDAIYAVDTEWRIEYMNDTMADGVDRDPAAVIGATLWEEFPSIVGTEIEDRYRTAMETGESVSFEQRVGEPFDYWAEVRAFPDDDGLTVFSRDITDKRERERERRRFENAVEHAGHAIFITDTDGTIEYVNPAFEEITGYTEAEALGENPRILKSGEQSGKYYETLWETITAGEVWQEQIINHRKSGERYVADQTIAPFERDGEVTGYVAIQTDITDRKNRESEYHQLAGEYEALLDSSGDAIFLLDVDTSDEDPRFEFARLSPGYETQTGLSTEEVKGRTPREVFGPERGAELHANYSRCVEAGEPISYHEELDVADDARFWDTSLAPVIVDGEIVRLVGIARNVTEQVERERALETTNQRLESLIEATPLTVMEIDTDGTVVRWNEGAEEMFGWSREAVLGEPNPIIPEDRTSEFRSHRERALGGDRIRGKEVRRERKDGTVLEALLSVVPIEGPDGEITSVLAVLEDISDQKRLERKLRSLQETAQRLTGARSDEEIGDLAVEAAVEILGFDVTAIWKHSEQAGALVPLAESDAAREAIGEAPRFTPGESLAWEAFEAGEVRVYDDLSKAELLHNDETDLSSELLVPVGDYGVMSAASVKEREFADVDVDLFRILGSTVEAAFARASREAELKRQNERLDEFASVVAHDLRNPLSVAIGFHEVIEETGELEYLDRIGSAHERMERLIEDLLTLASGESTIENTEQIDLEALTTEAWGYVDTDGATLTLDEEVPTVAGDAGRLTQLFENLFRNAVEHGGSDVTVTVGPLEDDGFYVEDDGPGIPPERRDEVFEHGVTYSDGGTGFGLSIVADIATAHGWTVSVTDGSDGGARFEFVMSK